MKNTNAKTKITFLYPAIFIQDEEGEYQAIFPDLNIYTNGKTLSEAFICAKNLLCVYFTYAMKYETEYTKPSKLEDIMKKLHSNEIAMFVDAEVLYGEKE